jgi:protein-tyrosine phosphatase
MKQVLGMELFPIDDDGRLFISPAIDDWGAAACCAIDVVIDLEGGLDGCIPTESNGCLYIYFPITDDDVELPPINKLRAIARLAASLIADGHRVLSHCGMGFNRSALVAGMILVELGMPGPLAVERLRARRPGALYNDNFVAFLESLRGPSVASL